LPSQIINNSIGQSSQAVMGAMPKTAILTRGIQRIRVKAKKAPSDPKTVQELVVPKEYQYYGEDEKENFLLVDTGADDPDRILVFGRESYEEWSHQIDKLYMDGTFKVIQFQMYAINSF